MGLGLRARLRPLCAREPSHRSRAVPSPASQSWLARVSGPCSALPDALLTLGARVSAPSLPALLPYTAALPLGTACNDLRLRSASLAPRHRADRTGLRSRLRDLDRGTVSTRDHRSRRGGHLVDRDHHRAGRRLHPATASSGRAHQGRRPPRHHRRSSRGRRRAPAPYPQRALGSHRLRRDRARSRSRPQPGRGRSTRRGATHVNSR